VSADEGQDRGMPEHDGNELSVQVRDGFRHARVRERARDIGNDPGGVQRDRRPRWDLSGLHGTFSTTPRPRATLLVRLKARRYQAKKEA